MLAKHRIFDDLLPYAQCTLANRYGMRSTLAKNTILHDFATACIVCASKVIPYAQCALAIFYRMRS
jgi:hypothetical protein